MTYNTALKEQNKLGNEVLILLQGYGLPRC